MRKKLGKLLMLLGICCLTAAASLILYNRHEARRVQLLSQELLVQLDAKAEQNRKQDPGELPSEPFEAECPTEPEKQRLETVEIDGLDYIGKLAIPDLGMELPVLSQWSDQNLRLAPCRYAGDRDTEDLVIMAHNYMTHFGQISTLTPGSGICFYDINQNPTTYEVVTIDILRPNQVEDMTVGDYPLTLFTCTYGGQNRVAVRCQEKRN